MESYLADRFLKVKVENTFSDWLRIVQGVLQGSVLGPLLFSKFMNDILHISFVTRIRVIFSLSVMQLQTFLELSKNL